MDRYGGPDSQRESAAMAAAGDVTWERRHPCRHVHPIAHQSVYQSLMLRSLFWLIEVDLGDSPPQAGASETLGQIAISSRSVTSVSHLAFYRHAGKDAGDPISK